MKHEIVHLMIHSNKSNFSLKIFKLILNINLNWNLFLKLRFDNVGLQNFMKIDKIIFYSIKFFIKSPQPYFKSIKKQKLF